ncbi:hypothetical protein BSKO_00371 [Bryopsis sp. KO-2023]|nr:hypothetical protein BSKO_00371 [Bryopsis sp. KO-2023]
MNRRAVTAPQSSMRAAVFRAQTTVCRLPSLGRCPLAGSTSVSTHRRRKSAFVVCSYPEPETEKERSPLDYPQEWVTPQPSRRPDIFPEFEKLDTPLPKPLPGDPEQPDEEEEVEKEKREPSPDPDEEEEEGEPEKEDTPEPSPEE